MVASVVRSDRGHPNLAPRFFRRDRICHPVAGRRLPLAAARPRHDGRAIAVASRVAAALPPSTTAAACVPPPLLRVSPVKSDLHWLHALLLLTLLGPATTAAPSLSRRAAPPPSPPPPRRRHVCRLRGCVSTLSSLVVAGSASGAWPPFHSALIAPHLRSPNEWVSIAPRVLLMRLP